MLTNSSTIGDILKTETPHARHLSLLNRSLINRYQPNKGKASNPGCDNNSFSHVFLCSQMCIVDAQEIESCGDHYTLKMLPGRKTTSKNLYCRSKYKYSQMIEIAHKRQIEYSANSLNRQEKRIFLGETQTTIV